MPNAPLQVEVLIREVLVREMLLIFLQDTTEHAIFVSGHEPPAGADVGRPDVLLASESVVAEGLDAWRGVPVLVVMEGNHPQDAARALHQGARGVIDPSSSLDELTEAIRAVAHGHTWLPPSQVSDVLAALAAGKDDSERAAVQSLTSREQQVLVLVGQGFDKQQIAEQLFISPHTVRTHVQNVLTKLGLHSQVAIGATARRAVQAGWVRADQ